MNKNLRKDTLAEHNEVRSKVKPTASDMLKMYYSSDLEKSAQAIADSCKFWHHTGDVTGRYYKDFGQNLYFSTYEPFDIKKAVMDWNNEVKDYDFNSNKCSAVCGHYTQDVWATSQILGCGYTLCSTIKTKSKSVNDAHYVVCHYYPRGNWIGLSPYNSGKSCSKCLMNASLCENNLCVPKGDPCSKLELHCKSNDIKTCICGEESYSRADQGVSRFFLLIFLYSLSFIFSSK